MGFKMSAFRSFRGVWVRFSRPMGFKIGAFRSFLGAWATPRPMRSRLDRPTALCTLALPLPLQSRDDSSRATTAAKRLGSRPLPSWIWFGGSPLSPNPPRDLDAQVREVRRMLASFTQKLTPGAPGQAWKEEDDVETSKTLKQPRR
jgi:hypothetical protein